MVESIRFDRHARTRHRTQPELITEAGWDRCVVFQSRVGITPTKPQIALLLLGSALSKYLWEIDTTIALVVLSMTSFGVPFYLFIIVAGQLPTVVHVTHLPQALFVVPPACFA